MADTEKNTEEVVEEKRRFESEIEEVGPCKFLVKIKVPVETISEEFDERYQEIIKTVAFPGFRVGHTPRRLVEKKLGDDIRGDVKETILTDSFKDAIEHHEIDPISDPDLDLDDIELVDGEPLEYEATFLVRPTVEVPDYDSISVTKVEPVVSEDRVNEVADSLRKQHAVLEPVLDEPVAEDDVAVLNFTAKVGEEKLVERENHEYTHPQPYLAGLMLESLPGEILGKGAGDEFVLTQTLPETWPNEEQAGQELTVEIEVLEVKRHRLPELDKELAEQMDYDDVAELMEEIREQVSREAEKEALEKTDTAMVDALLAAASFEIPEDVVKEETARRIERIRANLRMKGAGDDEVEEKLAKARSDEKAEVERDFRATFLMDAVAKKEKIFVTESAIDERISQMATSYNRTVEEMNEYLEQRDMLGSLRSQMREEQVMSLLREKIKVD